MSIKDMTVCEVSTMANVVPEVVRYYSRIGLIRPKINRKNGYKLYGKKDVSRIVFIRKAKTLGYTLKEIKKILSHATSGASPCPIVRQIIESRIKENRQHLDDMIDLQSKMEKAVQQWKNLPDGIPTRDTVCVLIETFADDIQDRNDEY